MLGATSEKMRRSHSGPAKPRSRREGRWAARPALRDPEFAKSIFADEEACEACRLNKAAERSMTLDDFVTLGPDGAISGADTLTALALNRNETRSLSLMSAPRVNSGTSGSTGRPRALFQSSAARQQPSTQSGDGRLKCRRPARSTKECNKAANIKVAFTTTRILRSSHS